MCCVVEILHVDRVFAVVIGFDLGECFIVVAADDCSDFSL